MVDMEKTPLNILKFVIPPEEEDPARAFELYEKNLFYQVQAHLPCVHCGKVGSVSNKGVSGNIDQRNIRRMSIACRGCAGPSFRFFSALEKSSGEVACLKDAVEALTAAESLIPIETASAKKLKQFTFVQRPLTLASVASTKRPRTASPTETVRKPAQDDASTVALLREMLDRERVRADKAESISSELLTELRELRGLLSKLQNKQTPVVSTTNEPSLNASKSRKADINTASTGSGVAGRKIPGLDLASTDSTTTADQRNNEEEPQARWIKVPTRHRNKQKGLNNPVASGSKPTSPTTTKKSEVSKQTAAPNKQTSTAPKAQQHHPTRPAKTFKKAAVRLLEPRKDPLEFKAIRVRINDTRPLMNVKGKERQRILTETVKNIGIHGHTALISTVGNSILEIYVTAEFEKSARDRITSRQLELLDNYNINQQPTYAQQSKEACREAIVKRLTHLCLIAKPRNLQEAILAGADEEMRDAVLDRYRKVSDKPDAVLGRTPAISQNSEEQVEDQAEMDTDEVHQ